MFAYKNNLKSAQDFLVKSELAEGGWGYRSDSTEAYPEPTCYSLLALKDTPFPQEKSLTWATKLVNEDGQLILPGDDSPNWGTSHLIITLTRLNSLAEKKEASINWLLAWESQYTESKVEDIELDSTLIGWPWISDTFSWVQPTAYAVLALKLSGLRTHPRVLEAEKLLFDRTCPGGGWNFGNPVILGRPVDPSLVETAITLLALQDLPKDTDEVTSGLRVLENGLPELPSALALAMGILCLTVYDRPVDQYVETLLARQNDNGSWGGMNWWTALAVLALKTVEEGEHVFRL